MHLPWTRCRSYLPGNISEPNNIFGSESCAVANYTETRLAQQIQATLPTFNGTGAVSSAWAWADAGCQEEAVSVCRALPELAAAPVYTPASSNASFQLLLGAFDWATAQGACNFMGGHLASWSSQREQVGGGGVGCHPIFVGTSRC
jgi:hypothetical protein